MIELIQPRHPYASEDSDSLGHIYLPNALMSVDARLHCAGIKTVFSDENFGLTGSPASPIVGFNVVGAPNIPTVVERISQLRKSAPHIRTFIVGGQGIEGLAMHQRQRLFGEHVPGDDIAALAQAFHTRADRIPHPAKVSISDTLHRLDDTTQRQYLEREFSLFLSQGCKYSCSFCSAKRTRHNETGHLLRVTEEFREMTPLREELSTFFELARKHSVPELRIYLSNLDLLQTPSQLHSFVDVVRRVRLQHREVRLSLRGLATVPSFLLLHRKEPTLLHQLRDIGLRRLGFGVDGATAEVWRSVRKPQRGDACLRAIDLTHRQYDITPETLMVFGHEGADTAGSLRLAVDFMKSMVDHCGAVPRPHVAKSCVPGNDGWIDPRNGWRVEYLLANPQAFQMLDYTALPSWLTHADKEFREMVSQAYMEACRISGCSTEYVMPVDPQLSFADHAAARSFNVGRFDV